MFPFIFMAGYLCAAPIMENRTKFEWNENDMKMINNGGCARVVGPQSPCPKKFYKIGERDYYVTCGAPLKPQNGNK